VTDIINLNTDVNLFGDEITDAPSIDREPLAAALYAQLKGVSLQEFVSYFTNGFEAVVDYANLVAGEKTGQRISLLFNPHRLDTGTKRFPISLYQALKDEKFVRGLARVVLLNKKKGNTKDLLYASVGMGVQGTSYVQEFPPHVARDLALEYGLTKNCHVLDPCAGWGGRMLGFSAVVNHYTCCEPSTRTAAGLRKIHDFIRSFRSSFHATINEAPFEDVTLPSEAFDFAMTSPPYYDTEWYAPGEKTSSGNRYPTFEAWCEGFYAPLIHRTMAALKPGAVFVINIGSRLYPLNDRLFAICKDKYHVQKQQGRLSASNGLGKTGEGETFYEVRKSGTYVLPEETSEAGPADMPAAQSLAAEEQTEAVDSSTDIDFPPVLDETEPSEEPVKVPTPAVTIPSAMDFAMAPRSLAEQLSETAPAPVVEAAPVVEQTAIKLTPHEVVERLRATDHLLFDRRGKLVVTHGSTLTDEERELIKEHKPALLVIVPPFPEPEATPAQSLVQFLGEQRRPEPEWKPEAPPILDGINEIEMDFESDGKDWAAGDRPIGVALRWREPGAQFARTKYFPWGHIGSPDNLDENVMRRWFEEQVKGKRITNAYTGFEVHMAREWGVDLVERGNTFSDVMHYAALLDDHRKRFALNELCKDFLNREKEGMDLDPRRMAHYTPYEVAIRAEGDVDSVGELRAVMWPQIEAEGLQAVSRLEDEIIPVVCEMEKNGAPINEELLATMTRDLQAHYESLIREVSHEAGFNFDDTDAAWQRLFERFNLPLVRTKGKNGEQGKISFKDAILARIEHPTIKKARFAAQLDSLNSKVFKPYPSLIRNGVLRFQLHQLRIDDDQGKRGTVSGRFSAPYIQQVPNHYNHAEIFGEKYFPRELYIPGSGLFLAGDAMQIEYRIFADKAKNARVLEAYRKDPAMSFHKFMFGIISPFKPDLLYTGMKNFNFMRMYGGGLVKTAVMMNFITEEEGDEITAAESQRTDPRLTQAREIDAIYAREMPEVKPLLKRAMHIGHPPECDKFCRLGDELHQKYKHRGYVKTALGRRSRFPTTFKLHKALNTVIQGTAADIMKSKLVDLYKQRKEVGFTMRMTIHDEICGDVPDKDAAERVSKLLNEQTSGLEVPILWEVGTGANWAEAK